jgi:hypothetical protein
MRIVAGRARCQQVNVEPAEKNLHYVWDDAVVVVLEKQLETQNPESTAHKLEALYPATDDDKTWKPDESEHIAWESHQLAESDVYRELGIPEKPCSLHSCDPSTKTPVALSAAYKEHEAPIAAQQLAKGGHRLAELLNEIWP